MWPEYSLCKELRDTQRGCFGGAWRERETQGGLATEAMSSTNCGSGGERLEESCCWGLSAPQKFPGGKALNAVLFVGSGYRGSAGAAGRQARKTRRASRNIMRHPRPACCTDGEAEATEAESICQGGHMTAAGNQELQDEGTG